MTAKIHKIKNSKLIIHFDEYTACVKANTLTDDFCKVSNLSNVKNRLKNVNNIGELF